ncbi:MAG TPA: hypothetical protein VKH42_09790 [Vicinamibacterales bacterium]|nr:hypothetical protein [Vicinamibacterales bacterium]
MAAVVTAAIAAPVVRAPSERIFGAEIVGRHYDPFLVMEQFAQPTTGGLYSQPITDISGALLARATGAVAAYNWLVLLSFPLSAAAAYLLARHLALSRTAATVVAMAFAFSPFHLAQAAYHPHVAQTQWIPLYLLALWRCLDDASPCAICFLAITVVTVTLSNFYGGLIAAAMSPFAIAGYIVARGAAPNARRSLIVTLGALGLMCAAGLAFVWWNAPSVLVEPGSFTMASGDTFRYSAKWWSYLVPPVTHPLLGAFARRVWTAADVREGLLEQQVSLGWGIVALGLIGLCLGRCRRTWVCALLAAVALVCSLAPEPTTWGIRVVRPSAILHAILPMFRAYARFGVVVQLMAALLAGLGIDRLRRSAMPLARVAWVALVTVAVGEYGVSPSALSRDVLPTAAHRWAARQTDRVRVLDCTPLDRESESVQWLTGYRVSLLTGAIRDCGEPNLSQKLAAHGFTHVLRRGAGFDDAQLMAIQAPVPAVYTDAMTGFSPREHDAEWTWRWMGGDASWTIVNTRDRAVVASLDLEASAFHDTRRMDVVLDGRPLQTVVVEPPRRSYQIGAFTLTPGAHELAFRPVGAPTVAADAIGNGDLRPLSFAIGAWTWNARSDE